MSNRLPLGPFTGGINLVDRNLGPNDLEFSNNWELDPLGIPSKRVGYGPIGSATNQLNGANPIQFLRRYYREDGTKITIGAAGGHLKTLNDVTGIWSSALSTAMHATNLYDSFTYKDYLFITDGTQPKRWNGTYFKDAKHFVHTVTGWTLTPGTSGLMNGTGASVVYQYKMCSVEGVRGEGPPSAAKSVTLTSAQNSVALTTLDSADVSNEATFKNLYRTKANGSIFYFVAQLAAGATNYTDVLADSALGEELIVVHNPAADNRYAFVGADERTYWFGRSGINASLVEVSDVGFPERIIDGSSAVDPEFMAIDNNNSGALTGGCVIPGGMLFFKNNSTWLCRAFGLGVLPVSKNVGTSSRFSIVSVPGGAIWLGTDGQICSYINGQLDAEIIGRKVKPEFTGYTAAVAARVFARYYKRKYRIFYDPKGSKGYNVSRLDYDTLGKKWDGPHSNSNVYAFSYIATVDEAKDGDKLLLGFATNSYVYQQIPTHSTDNGTIIVASYRTGQTPGRNVKIIYKIFKKGKYSSGAEISVVVISEDGSFSTLLDTVGVVATNPLYWNVGTWNNFNWSGSVPGELESGFYICPKGTRIQVETTESGTASFATEYETELLAEALDLR